MKTNGPASPKREMLSRMARTLCRTVTPCDVLSIVTGALLTAIDLRCAASYADVMRNSAAATNSTS